MPSWPTIGASGPGCPKDGEALGALLCFWFSQRHRPQPQHQTGVPRLSHLTEKSLEILKKNPQGFFLMVEGGQVDWVEYRNDVASVLHEMLEFDQTIGLVMAFAEQNPDTLVVVTADHDTGGLAIAYNNVNPPAPLNSPAERPGRRSIILPTNPYSTRWLGKRSPSEDVPGQQRKPGGL